MKINAIVVLFSVSLLAAADGITCVSPPAKYRDFFQLPHNERVSAFRTYDRETQVDLYLVAMVVVQPSNWALAEVVAEGGMAILPILIRRMEEGKETTGQMSPDDVKVTLLDVITTMQLRGIADIAQDEETMVRLQELVAVMQDSFYKREAERKLDTIRRAVAREKPAQSVQ